MSKDICDRIDEGISGVLMAGGEPTESVMTLIAAADEAIDEIRRLRYTRDQLLARIARLEGMP